jgi:hypothetical protein
LEPGEHQTWHLSDTVLQHYADHSGEDISRWLHTIDTGLLPYSDRWLASLYRRSGLSGVRKALKGRKIWCNIWIDSDPHQRYPCSAVLRPFDDVMVANVSAAGPHYIIVSIRRGSFSGNYTCRLSLPGSDYHRSGNDLSFSARFLLNPPSVEWKRVPMGDPLRLLGIGDSMRREQIEADTLGRSSKVSHELLISLTDGLWDTASVTKCEDGSPVEYSKQSGVKRGADIPRPPAEQLISHSMRIKSWYLLAPDKTVWAYAVFLFSGREFAELARMSK